MKNNIIKTCSTEDFWIAMYSFSFVRLDLYSGYDKNIKYITDKPPELVDRFIKSKTQKIINDFI